MNRRGLKLTACSIASAVVIAGTTIISSAAPVAGISGITSVDGGFSENVVAGVSLVCSNYLSQS